MKQIKTHLIILTFREYFFLPCLLVSVCYRSYKSSLNHPDRLLNDRNKNKRVGFGLSCDIRARAAARWGRGGMSSKEMLLLTFNSENILFCFVSWRFFFFICFVVFFAGQTNVKQLIIIFHKVVFFFFVSVCL